MGSTGAMSPSQVIDQACGVLFSGLKSVLDMGNTVCIQMPKRALVLCFTIQKEIVFLPFRCLNKVYEAVLRPPAQYLLHIYGEFTKEGPTPIEILTGRKDPTHSQVIESTRKIRIPVYKAIARENNSKSQLSLYRKQLEKWKMENEKRTEEIYKISVEEKELMKAVASALRYLRSLKAKREKMSDNFLKNISNMINTGSLSEDKFLAMQKEIINVDAAINEKKRMCLNLLGQGRLPDEDILGVNSSKTQTHPAKTDGLQVVSSTDAMQKVLSLVVDENLYLKNRLASTHCKVEEILSLSENINKEILVLSEKFTKMTTVNAEMAHLQDELEKEREMLKVVEADRDRMRDKLQTLDFMIKEEEEFLGSSETSMVDACFMSFTEGSMDQDLSN